MTVTVVHEHRAVIWSILGYPHIASTDVNR
jgi:hypothetical protein